MATPEADTASTMAPAITTTHAEGSSVAKSHDTMEDLVVKDQDEELPSDADEETRLKFLTTGTRAQDDLERDIGRQADQLLTEQADARDKKRIEKAETEAKRAEGAIQKLRNRLALPAIESQKAKMRGEIAMHQSKIDDLDKEMDAIQQRINDRHNAPDGEEADQDGVNGPLPNESRRDFLIRTGKITPFSKLAQDQSSLGTLGEVMQDAEVEDMPGFQDAESGSEVSSHESTTRSRKRRKITPASDAMMSRESSAAPENNDGEPDDAFEPGMTDRQLATSDDSEAFSEDAMEDDDYEEEATSNKRRAGSKKKKTAKTVHTEEVVEEDLAGVDDGNERVYRKRIDTWTKDRAAARRRTKEKNGESVTEEEGEEESYLPHPTEADTEFDGGFRIPGDIYPALFDYQKTGVQWLWELYSQNVGGIIGDEMGLGKTIQAISFVAGLHYSKLLTKPVIVVCPATVMKQWVNEFHRWWPALRVSILHTSGSGMLDTRREDRLEREMELKSYGDYDKTLTGAGKSAKKILEKVKRDGHVLVTTYSGLQTYSEFLIPTEWECAILDEGHKIRNPNTSITIHSKELRTPNRIILSGTPMQNNLTELWSLFDFVFPMRLGTLVNFRNQFEFPIKRGGYANASNLEFETAVRCAETLKDAVSPYLLQRFKVDVATDLPQKKEQVLFCKLTRQQRQAYEGFLQSEDMKSIANGKRQMLFGVDYLRKICNHPDLTEHKTLSKDPSYDYGAPNKSGKMQVVKELLSLWTKGGHKTLLFAQHRIMLDILQRFLNSLPDINYRRMDGETPIKNRQDLVDEFNKDPDLHVFLLTTKVGGLGVNLTGANRVIIYDPDWNPSTDIQARERSWRLGQKREVEIYRLMSAGTIEEKIYHRQIFKQFLTNKVLKDPKQRQTFQMSDLHDLFTLGGEQADGETETGNMFRGSEVKFDQNGETETPTSDATASKDLAAMVGIDRAVAFQAPPSETEDHTQQDGTATDGDAPADSSRLMSTIFARTGVHSVLEHDAIVNSTANGRKRKIQADPAFVQREAKRQAAMAAEQLRKSMEEARLVPAGVPTWTGTFGEAGRPDTRPTPASSRGGRGGRGGGGLGRGAPSSTSILSNLAARQGRTLAPSATPTSTSASSSRASTPVSASSSTFRGRRMLEMIRDFMMTHGGAVPTRMLVDHFDHYCRAAPGRSEEFKEMLKAIATLEKNGSAQRGRWVLKDEWRTPRAGGGRG
ncbi:DNA repair and recombination protein RAD26 [Dothidotthia symphoricarpi CBS 119687]|uniref:DNA repair and recombination protein RAD26 n=1 Tax=Dothidotthia symphoricarpi CBS 119687 TaxID=1392245 RepID=A0A6A6AQI8_9PLEO|nr:DNA repair and recombination protein RAD26 [Dothidotthia symphoricarpi CBS 119687]KAF2133214.1 DNA repair and recombination protein RAD26 [Dothidotthia symphoricarpi CBS 119687]